MRGVAAYAGGSRTALEQRAYRRSVQDGLVELLAGGLFVVVAAAFLTESPLSGFIGLSPFVLGAAYRRLRARVSEPRIGFVDLDDESARSTALGMARHLSVVLAFTAFGVGVTGGLTSLETWIGWSGGFAGMATAGAFHHLAERSGWMRYRALALLSAVAGVGASLVATDQGYRTVGWWALTLAPVLLVQGAAMLVVFVRRNPIATAPDEEGSPPRPGTRLGEDGADG